LRCDAKHYRAVGAVESTKGRPYKALGHPSWDWKRFEAAKSSMDDLVERTFLNSPLWPNSSANSWCFGNISNVSDTPDTWSELSAPKPLSPNKKIRSVLTHLRNALAHGNIFTRGSTSIEQIILLSRPAEEHMYCFLAVAPDDFLLFLKNWLGFLRDIELPDEVIEWPDTVNHAP
jgi:hypothetical protein